jgi:hypothetical protein
MECMYPDIHRFEPQLPSLLDILALDSSSASGQRRPQTEMVQGLCVPPAFASSRRPGEQAVMPTYGQASDRCREGLKSHSSTMRFSGDLDGL